LIALYNLSALPDIRRDAVPANLASFNYKCVELNISSRPQITVFRVNEPGTEGRARTAGRNDPCVCGSGRKYKHCCAGRMRLAILAPSAGPATIELQLAARLRQAGHMAESLPPMERAVQRDPGNAAAQHDLGLTYMNCGRIEDAANSFRRAIALKGDFAHAHYRLGLALELQGHGDAAIISYQHAVALKRSLADAQSRLGNLLLSHGRRKEATDAFRAVAAALPNTTEGRLALVKVFRIEDKDHEAEIALRRALARDQRSSAGHWMLGTILTEAGKFNEAWEEFERSIALEPLQGIAYYDLVRTRTLCETDRPLIERMRSITSNVNDIQQQVLLQFALGKSFEDLKDYGTAMGHYVQANYIKRAIVPFDRASVVHRVDSVIARFTPDFIATHRASGNVEALPVLILGMPRSGTTLVEQIISNHPQVAGGGELHVWTRPNQLFQQTVDTEIAPFQRQAELNCLRRLREIAPRAARVTDKMPFNFFAAGLIHLVFPRATIIHCRRNPVDTCLSVFSTFFAPRADFSTDRDDLVFYYHQYLRLMAHWQEVLPPDRFVEVDYEALVTDPERVSRRLIAACGLDWDPACLSPESNTRAVKTASKWQARQPIHPGAVERWRRYEPWIGSFRDLLTQ
jgi:tetratricopeptide (TPR) repeat protein